MFRFYKACEIILFNFIFENILFFVLFEIDDVWWSPKSQRPALGPARPDELKPGPSPFMGGPGRGPKFRPGPPL